MPKKVVVISQDYDGCYSIMTENGLQAELTLNKKYWDKKLSPGKRIPAKLAAIRQSYDDYLDTITNDANEVHMYVGSDRQSYHMDNLNIDKHKNGSVFEALWICCGNKATAKKPWIFEPLLMSDPLDDTMTPYGRRRGVSLQSIHKNPDGIQLREVDPYKIKNSKRSMLLYQMWDAYRQNPDATEIDFYFVDDRDDLLQDVLKNITCEQLPPNMRLHVVKFDYIGMCHDEPGALGELKPMILGLAASKPSLELNKALQSLSIFSSERREIPKKLDAPPQLSA